MEVRKTKLFPFHDVFVFQRGQRLIEEDQVAGDVPYVSSTKENNGISGFVTPPDFMVRHRNNLTLANSGSVGYCFYHDYEFVASDHVTVIGIKDASIQLSKALSLYLKPVIESFRYKYNFGREISDSRLSKEYVLLPFDTSGDPDWSYMTSYIEALTRRIEWHSIPLHHADKPISLVKWQSFPMDYLFAFFKGKRLTKENLRPGQTNFIGAISANNGIREKIDEPPLYPGKCITVNYNGSVGKSFYQADPFWASDDVNVLYLKDREMNVYLALFLTTIIEQNRVHFDFGRKWNTEKMKATQLLLPTTVEGQPDWDYMEMFMRSLPLAEKIISDL
ncbi:MAG: restriction endonuclease subunit S [Dechloromonas sp.]|nr:restriction endonuclease subunit S [Dechloromonas sp.]